MLVKQLPWTCIGQGIMVVEGTIAIPECLNRNRQFYIKPRAVVFFCVVLKQLKVLFV